MHHTSHNQGMLIKALNTRTLWYLEIFCILLFVCGCMFIHSSEYKNALKRIIFWIFVTLDDHLVLVMGTYIHKAPSTSFQVWPDRKWCPWGYMIFGCVLDMPRTCLGHFQQNWGLMDRLMRLIVMVEIFHGLIILKYAIFRITKYMISNCMKNVVECCYMTCHGIKSWNKAYHDTA